MASTVHGQPMPDNETQTPLGIRAIERVRSRCLSYNTYQGIALILTFLAYATYHLTREATSEALKSASDGGWEPFNPSELTTLNHSFLILYASEMYFAGILGDRWSLRMVLAVGMLGCGCVTAMYGFGYWLGVHTFQYYSWVEVLAAALQSTGWPLAVAVVGNWVDQKRRGLVLGIWNSNILFGNLAGSSVASWLSPRGWGWPTFVSGLVIGFMSLLVYLFLLDRPLSTRITDVDEAALFIPESEVNEARSEDEANGYREAWKIPGIVTYALCAFFIKSIAIMFLYWLSFFIENTGAYFVPLHLYM